MRYSNNSVYRNGGRENKLPVLNKDSTKGLTPKVALRPEVNKSELSFPNSALKLDVTSTYDQKSKQLKFVFNVQNVEKEDKDELEQKLNAQIQKQIKKLALKKIIKER